MSGNLMPPSENPSLFTQLLYSLSVMSNDETLLFECNSNLCKVSSSDTSLSSQATQSSNGRMINSGRNRFITAILQSSSTKCLETNNLATGVCRESGYI